MKVSAFGATHAGARPVNEDACFVDGALGLFLVADGLGGHNAGEVASRLAVDVIADAIRGDDRRSPGHLERAIGRANETILESSRTTTARSGMGTTVAAVLALDDAFAVASVGDSRVYRWRDGTLEQLTQDDSWVSRLFPETSPASVAARARHPLRHVLTEVVGVRPQLDARAQTSALEPGDAFLLCTDGLYGALPPAGVIACFEGDVDRIATRLVARAVEAGASDNVTAVVVRRDA